MNLLWIIGVIACVFVVVATGNNIAADSLEDPSELSDYEIASSDVPMKQNCDCMKAQAIKKEVVGKSKVSPHVECQKQQVMVDDESLTDGNEDTEEMLVEEDTDEIELVEEDVLLEDVVEEVEEFEPKQKKPKDEKLQAPLKGIKQKYKTVDESIETIEQLMDSNEEPTKPIVAKKNTKSPKETNKIQNTKSGKVSEKKSQKTKSSSEKFVVNKKASKSSGKYAKNSENTNKKNKQKTMKTNEKSKKSNKSKKTKSKKNEL